jgi:hypothetical protein
MTLETANSAYYIYLVGYVSLHHHHDMTTTVTGLLISIVVMHVVEKLVCFLVVFTKILKRTYFYFGWYDFTVLIPVSSSTIAVT